MKVNTPKYSNYITFEARYETFVNWILSMKQKPKDCAEAGFFYICKGDKLVCYHCGIGLMNWEDEDIPREEHKRWSPDCYHVQNQDNLISANIGEHENPSTPAGPSSGQVVSSICLKCEENKPDIVFLPCLHITTCNNCYPSVTTCPTCQEDRTGIQRIFFG